MVNMDLYFFDLINGLAGRYAWLDFLGVFLAKYFEYVLLFCLILFLFVYPIKSAISGVSPEAKQFNRVNYRKYWRMVLEAIVAAVFTRFILAEIMRWLFFRPRPFVTNQVNQLINYNSLEASFPSGHACFYFALSTIIYFYNKKLGIIFYLASFLIVLSRVFVGIHWPSDILAGAILGILMGVLLNRFFRKHGHKIIKNYNN
jgi:undecaprenyl-diphosphatase